MINTKKSLRSDIARKGWKTRRHNNKLETIRQIIKKITKLIEEKKFILNTEIDNSGNDKIIISLVDKKDNNIGNIEINIFKDFIKQLHGRKTRSEQELEDWIIYVNWLHVNPVYKRKKYGTLILIYAICKVVELYPHIEYATLDDVSDNADKVKNIYHSLLFGLDESTKLNDHKRIELNGPEKTAYIGYDNYFNVLMNKVSSIESLFTKNKTQKNKNKTQKNKNKTQKK